MIQLPEQRPAYAIPPGFGKDIGEKIKEPKIVNESLRPAVSEASISSAAKKTPDALRSLSGLAARAGAASAATDKREEERE